MHNETLSNTEPLYTFLSIKILTLIAIICSPIMLVAQIPLNLSNDTRANDRYCDHAGQVFIGCGQSYTDDGGSGLYSDDIVEEALSGPSNNYGDDAYEPIFWTFCPDDPVNRKIRLTFTEFGIHDSDKFYVYDGSCSLANGDRNETTGVPGQDDDQSLDLNNLVQIAGATPQQMSKIAGTGTASFGAGWVEASCSNASGCITIGWNPDGDGNKGVGWNFRTACVNRNADIVCNTSIDVNDPLSVLSYDGLTIGCGEGTTLPVPPPTLVGCARGSASNATAIAAPYIIEILLDGFSLGYVSGANPEYPEMTVGVGRHTVTYVLHFNKYVEGSTNSNQFFEQKRVSCSFTIFDSVDLVCSAEINVSLGNDCSTQIVPSDMVETECAPAYPLTLVIGRDRYVSICSSCRFKEEFSNDALSLEEGTHEYIMRDDCNNACFGKINLRDIQGPQCLDEPIRGVYCAADVAASAPNFLDCNQVVETSFKESIFGACGKYSGAEVATLTNDLNLFTATEFSEISSDIFIFIGSETDNNPVTGTGSVINTSSTLTLPNNSSLESIIVRNWTAIDSKNNVTDNCLQVLPIIRPDTLYMPTMPFIEVQCGEGISPQALYNLTNPNGTKRFDKSHIAPWYQINETSILGTQTVSEYILPEVALGCHYASAYTDQLVQVVGKTRKISRTWTWLDWCAPTPSRTQPFVQAIKIIDDKEPFLISGPTTINRSADLFDCAGNITLDQSEWGDGCGNIVSYRTEIRKIKSNGDIGQVLWENNENGGTFQDIDLGCYYVLYYAADENGNETSNFGTDINPWAPKPLNVAVATLCVEDDVKPQARCHDQINIALRASVDRIYARDIDADSYDNCGVQSLEISFSEDDDTFGPYLEVTCNNVLKDLQLYLRVTDSNNNTNKCFGTVTLIPQEGSVDCSDIINTGDSFTLKGKIVNPNRESMQTVTIKAYKEASTEAVITDASGSYNLQLPKGPTYTIKPEKTHDLLNGISTFDLILINKHILSLELFTSPYQYIAADANKSGSITAFDMVVLRQLILNKITVLENNASWRFIPANYSFNGDLSTSLDQTFPDQISINSGTTDYVDLDFIGIKIGDINGSANPNDLQITGQRNTLATLQLQTPEQFVEAGTVIQVPFTMEPNKTIEGYQFTLSYPEFSLVEIVEGLATKEHFNTTYPNAFITSWLGNTPSEKTYFTANFISKTSGWLSDLISLNSTIIKAEAYAPNQELLDIALVFTPQKTARVAFDLLQNVPNPFDQSTSIRFSLPEIGMAKLSIWNAQGQLVKLISKEYEKGYHEVVIQKEDLQTSGLLYYRLESANHIASKKMLLVK